MSQADQQESGQDQPEWWHVWLIGLGVAASFILTYALIYGIGTWTSWGVPTETIVGVMAGLVAAALPLGLIWNRLTKLKVWEIEIELAAVAAQSVGLPPELSGAGTAQLGMSYIDPILRNMEAIVTQTPKPKILTLNIDLGPAWWSTRVFLVAALAQEYTEVQQIVFLENCAGPHDCFIGSATPAAIRQRFAAKQPFLEEKYHQASHQGGMFSVGMGFVGSFPQPDGEAQQQITVAKQLLREWLDQDLMSGYVEWHDGPPPTWMLQKIVARPEPFVALVQCGRLKMFIDRLELVTRLAANTLKPQ